MRAKLGLAAIIGLATLSTLVACGGKSSSLPAFQPASHAAADGAARTKASYQAYSAAVLADAPLVYYRTNETSGTTAADSSGHSYSGTYGSSVTLGGTALVTGDAAPTFPGGTSSSAKVLKSPTSSALAVTGAMSVEFWVNVPSSVTTTKILFTQPFSNGASYYPVYVSLDNGSPAYFTVQLNTTNGVVATYPTAVLGAKNHVVLTWTGSTLTAYVNGTSAGTATGSGSLTNYASPYTGFTVGGPVDAHAAFAGQVGEFALYNTALSSTRVSAHYNAAVNADPSPPPSSYAGIVLADNPLAYYRTNESSGTTATDASGHGYNGTYGSSVTLGGTGFVPGDTAPSFPGGTSSSAKVLKSPASSALALTGSMSVEFWVNVPSSVTSTQILFTQPFSNGNSYYPVYVSLDNGSPAYFTVQLNTTGGVVATYPTAVLGAKNHVVLTWNGSTLTAYVNGVSSSTATGSGSLTNFASPYTGFTVGGPVDAHTGFTGALGEFAIYNSVLPAARVLAHYNAGSGSSSSGGTLVWQTGGGTLGQYDLPSTSDGQCSGVGPVINGNNATFTSLRNTSTTYSYNGHTYSGASTCYRNQMNPRDPSTGTNSLLVPGNHYTFTFQTVVTFNGNTLYQGASSGGLAADIPAIVWQTHSYGGSGSPCDLLVIGNTFVAYSNGVTKYGTVSQGGLPTWNFHTCDESDYSGNAYNSPDTLYDGEVDNWQIDITAQIQGQSGGYIVVQRNGSVVYNAASHICDNSTSDCFWNFGAYTFYYETTEEPPGWNNAGITVQFNNMKLVKT
ncbi:MAG: cell surface protein [Candidatus Eremiobacteraeota bacterium]|nr:cell surface protein [Candidatus Eremiobacteraeota bacterium]